MCIALAKSGCHVAAVFHGNVDRALEFQKEFTERTGAILFLIKADVSKSDQCRDAVNQVVEKFGRIDILVKYVSL
jgi:NAD(P)-dependent dehydrogenase (short-subunit alcohol dehydrogenase family)